MNSVTRPAIRRAAWIGDGVTIAFRDWAATIEQIDWYRAAGGDNVAGREPQRQVEALERLAAELALPARG